MLQASLAPPLHRGSLVVDHAKCNRAASFAAFCSRVVVRSRKIVHSLHISVVLYVKPSLEMIRFARRESCFYP